jgi:hypothetical protein
MTFRDPTAQLDNRDVFEAATGMPFVDGTENLDINSDHTIRGALTGLNSMMTPAYLQEGYQGPQTGMGPVADFAAGMGQVFQGGSGAGSLGAPALLASQAVNNAADAMGTMGGAKRGIVTQSYKVTLPDGSTRWEPGTFRVNRQGERFDPEMTPADLDQHGYVAPSSPKGIVTASYKETLEDGTTRWVPGLLRGKRPPKTGGSTTMGTMGGQPRPRGLGNRLSDLGGTDAERAALAARLQGEATQAEQLKSWITPQIRDHGPGIYWHGSPSGDLRGGTSGLHLGTHDAATQALEARIGVPATGSWDGTREYGKTLLAGRKTLMEKDPRGYLLTGKNASPPMEDYYPTEPIKYSGGVSSGMDIKPSVRPFKLTGEMVNTRASPKTDTKANAIMAANAKKGNAKRGLFYRNEGEDVGSISLAVPSGSSHLSDVNLRGFSQSSAVTRDDALARLIDQPAPGMGRIVDPKENLRTVVDSNFTGPTKIKTETVPIDRLRGSMSSAADDAKRADDLAKKIASPDGYFERIIVDGNTGDVIEGQHRLAAARKLGVKDVPVLAIYDATHGMPVSQMKAAISAAQKIPSDHVNQIVNQVAEAINEAGSIGAVRAGYEAPRGFEAAWNAALDAAQLGPQS